MKIKENYLCSFCQDREETLCHSFCECQHVKPVILYIRNTLEELQQNIDINTQTILLGSTDKDVKLDILLLEYKKYIFFCKRKDIMPNITGLTNSLRYTWNIYFNQTSKEKENWKYEETLIA